jgi:hypothetical protein
MLGIAHKLRRCLLQLGIQGIAHSLRLHHVHLAADALQQGRSAGDAARRRPRINERLLLKYGQERSETLHEVGRVVPLVQIREVDHAVGPDVRVLWLDGDGRRLQHE